MSDAQMWWMIGALVLGAAVSGLLGMWLWPGPRAARRRIVELEEELAGVRAEAAAYRAQVEKHFAQTSDLFRDLTRQYTALYAHLAEGARELVPDRAPELTSGFAAPALTPPTPEPAPPAPETPDEGTTASEPEAAEPEPRVAAVADR